MMMRRGHRQKHRHRHVLVVHAAVGEHDDARAVIDRLLDLAANELDLPRQPCFAAREGPQDGNPPRLVVFRQPGKRMQLAFGQERRVRDDEMAMLRRLGEQVASPPHDGRQGHHKLLANRIDRRICDLREELFKIRVEQSRLQREHRERRVIAHRADPLGRVPQHRQEHEVEFLTRVPERNLPLGERENIEFRGGGPGGRVLHEVREAKEMILDPLAVRPLPGERILDLRVAQQLSRDGVDCDHLAGAKPAFLDDLRIVDSRGAHLRAEREESISREAVARGAQAIAVETRADRAAVAEDQRGGSIPRFVQTGMVLIEGREFWGDRSIAPPRRRNEHRHGVQEAAPAHRERLERVVDARGI